MTTQELVNQFKSTVISLGTKSVMSYLSVQVPFFNLPIVRYFTEKAVEKLIEIIVYYTELGAYFTYIDIKTNKQASDFAEAAKKYQEDPSDENRQAKIDRARDLINFRH